jgi:hypothetical protein
LPAKRKIEWILSKLRSPCRRCHDPNLYPVVNHYLRTNCQMQQKKKKENYVYLSNTMCAHEDRREEPFCSGYVPHTTIRACVCVCVWFMRIKLNIRGNLFDEWLHIKNIQNDKLFYHKWMWWSSWLMSFIFDGPAKKKPKTFVAIAFPCRTNRYIMWWWQSVINFLVNEWMLFV